MTPQYAMTPKTILVVDDDASVVEAVHKILGKYSYRVLNAATAEQAIAVVKEQLSEIDLLLVDAVMPKMSGPELADILLFLRPHMKVIFITGLDSLTIRLAFDRACECVQKPFTAQFLISKIQEALGESSLETDGQIASALDC
jgi:two-component system cell cycle sensor histidine kinase/response regulator CckA